MITSRADLFLNLGCGSTGMPRPLSVTDRKPSSSTLHLDPGGVAGHGLVHAVVDHLGEQVVQRLLVGAADVHAGPAPHGLQAFQHLDVGGRVAVGAVGWACGRHEPLFLSPPVSSRSLRPGLPDRLPSHARHRAALRRPPAPPPAAPAALSRPARPCRAWIRRICRTGRARLRSERLAWGSSPHSGVIITGQANATHRGAATMANPSNPVRLRSHGMPRMARVARP